ncbi:hypothetical protein ACH5RR_003053 [Cinchona calisaya]|uniref:Uncharacterized protein n=1 Tax=Cinchona calisaya TaxID=153742 RepID=A0ABD3ATQ1_9GENT
MGPLTSSYVLYGSSEANEGKLEELTGKHKMFHLSFTIASEDIALAISDLTITNTKEKPSRAEDLVFNLSKKRGLVVEIEDNGSVKLKSWFLHPNHQKCHVAAKSSAFIQVTTGLNLPERDNQSITLMQQFYPSASPIQCSRNADDMWYIMFEYPTAYNEGNAA